MTLRADQLLIADLIPENSKVIDIGCGEGELLSHLIKEKNISDYGLEIESERVAKAVSNGISVIQGDADEDLIHYADKSFDYAVLALTLQITKKPKKTLEEILRISKKSIVVIPNFGHIRNRLYLTYLGRMPVTKSLSFQWYNTPNIHFCTIRDFIFLTQELECTIEKRLCMINNTAKPFIGNGTFGANVFGDQGIFVLSKDN